MRIALCLEAPIAQHGGVEVLASELVEALSKQHEIVLVSPDDSASLAWSQIAALITAHIAFKTPWTASSARDLAEKIAVAKPDLVHFHFGGNYGWGNRIFWKCPIFYLGQKGVPCFSTNHGAFSILEGYCWEKRPLAVKLALLAPAWLSKQVVLARLRCEIAVSQHDWRALRRWYPLLRDKFRWIYHSRLHGTPPAPNFNRENIIICAGTIGPRKGQPVLVEAFARIVRSFPQWRLILVGRSGDELMLRQIRQIIGREKLEQQIYLLGPRSDDELRDLLQRAAIFAMPSVYEGLGLALQEAQFYGCASVGTRCGGVEDLIQHGDNGLLVEVNHPEQLAVALKRLMSDSNLRDKFSRRGPESIIEKRMTAEEMSDAYEKLYAGI